MINKKIDKTLHNEKSNIKIKKRIPSFVLIILSTFHSNIRPGKSNFYFQILTNIK